MAHDEQYNFYSGEDGGTYYRIGEAIEGRCQDDGDVIHNCRTGGCYDNTMKVTIEGNSFGLIQQEMMRDNDQLRNEVRVVAPIFLERMHILYRKELLKDFVNSDGGSSVIPGYERLLFKTFHQHYPAYQCRTIGKRIANTFQLCVAINRWTDSRPAARGTKIQADGRFF